MTEYVDVSDYRGAVLDIDGTLLRGNSPVEGAPELVDKLRKNGLEILFFSNNPTKSVGYHAERLSKAGIKATKEEVVTSATSTSFLLSSSEFLDSNLNVYVVGEHGLIEELEKAGVTILEKPEEANCVVASIDRDLSYETLERALRVFEGVYGYGYDDERGDGRGEKGDEGYENTVFVATDPDGVIPVKKGNLPGSGSVVGAIQGMIGREPDYLAGKPSETAVELILERMNVEPSDCIVIGDRLETDIEMGKKMNAKTILTKTGVTNPGVRDEDKTNPDYVVDSVSDLVISR